VHVDHVVVVSPERDTVPLDVSVIMDAGEDLNGALDVGRAYAVSRGARELLVLAADLPEATAAEIDLLITAGRRSGVAIAPIDPTGTMLFSANPRLRLPWHRQLRATSMRRGGWGSCRRSVHCRTCCLTRQDPALARGCRGADSSRLAGRGNELIDSLLRSLGRLPADGG
jgi:hypothetical protein